MKSWADEMEEIGIRKGKQEAIILNLEIRFGELSQQLTQCIRKIDLDRIDEVVRLSVSCQSLEEFEAEVS